MSRADRHVGLLGGSFNPPHIGHQMLAFWALSTAQIDEVWFVPTYRHAFQKTLVDFEHRVAMCRLAARDFPSGSVSVCEIEKEIGGESRTLLTLQTLQRQFETARFTLLVGVDVAQEISNWYGSEEIQQRAGIIIGGRGGYPLPERGVAMPEISSSAIRNSLERNENVDHCVPRSVLNYIASQRLYAR